MPAIRDAVKKQARGIIIGLLREQFKKKSTRYEVTKMVDRILSIRKLAIVDRGAKVPEREKLVKGNLLLQAEDENDIYLNGQLFAQEKMLKEGWIKEER